MNRDEEHLRLLSIFHYILGALGALFFSLFPVIHLTFGLMLIFAPHIFEPQGDPPPAFLGWIFVIPAALMMALGWTLAGCMIATGRFLARRTHYLFCLVVAAIESTFMPLGTVLGVFTIIVLTRESVKELFEANRRPGAGEV